MTMNRVAEQRLVPNLRKMSRKICASPVNFPDESKFWSCPFVIFPSQSYCYLLKRKPVLQESSRGNRGSEFSNRSRTYLTASPHGGKIPFLRVISQEKLYLFLLVSMKVKEY